MRPPLTRCRCTPLCLSPLYADDDVVATPDGDALREHVTPDPYPVEQLVLDVEAVSA